MKASALCCAIMAMAIFSGCSTTARQRGMSGAAYISTSRPAVSLQAEKLPLLTAGEGFATLLGYSMPAGMTTRVWLAVYGENSPTSPLAIVAHAEVQAGWYWDGIMRRPFSLNESVEVIGGLEMQACTYLVEGDRDPFTPLAAGTPDTPIRWIARGFAARSNFYEDKIILEYRERLPQEVNSLNSLPLAYGDFVREFEQRARESFRVGPVPSQAAIAGMGRANAVRWRYMAEKFLGTATRYDNFSRD
jgi:hypothetical protein